MTANQQPVNPGNNSTPAGKPGLVQASRQTACNTQSFTSGELQRRIGDVTAHHANSTHA